MKYGTIINVVWIVLILISLAVIGYDYLSIKKETREYQEYLYYSYSLYMDKCNRLLNITDFCEIVDEQEDYILKANSKYLNQFLSKIQDVKKLC